MKLPVLYKKDKKGSIRVWKIQTDQDVIYTSHGQEDGAMQVANKKIKGKNIGRKNETSPEEQAKLEALSMWKKQIDKGYVENRADLDKVVLLPMLAGDFEKRKKKVKYPAHVQPKLDGVRCLAMWDGDEIKLISRGGKEYNLPHIIKELKPFLNKNTVLDGEIYLHGVTFQEVSRLVKKHREGETEKLEYWVYDTFSLNKTNLPWAIRIRHIHNTVPYYRERIKITPTLPVDTEEEVYEAQKAFVDLGYEGAIVRELGGHYEINKRSNHLLKVKSFQDAEYKIVGCTEGQGKFEGCVIWICETEEGREFNVVPAGTLKQKQKWFKEGEKYIGSMLKVKFFELSEDNVPRFPVGLGIRLQEDI